MSCTEVMSVDTLPGVFLLSAYVTEPGPSEGAAAEQSAAVYAPFARRYLVLDQMILPLGSHITTIIGRDAAASHVVLADTRVSKRHAAIRFRDGCYFLEDLGSRNGTHLNGRRVETPAELRPGDRIGIHPYAFRFADSADPSVRDVHDAAFPLDRIGQSDLAGVMHRAGLRPFLEQIQEEKRTGRLRVLDAIGQPAHVFFEDGDIVWADYLMQTGPEALNRLGGASRDHTAGVLEAMPVLDDYLFEWTCEEEDPDGDL